MYDVVFRIKFDAVLTEKGGSLEKKNNCKSDYTERVVIKLQGGARKIFLTERLVKLQLIDFL